VVEEAVIKLLYKPVGLLINWLYGVLAGAVVNRVWTSAARADDAPKATDAQRRWKSFQMARTRDRDRLRRLRRWERGSRSPDPGAPRLPAAQDPGGITQPQRQCASQESHDANIRSRDCRPAAPSTDPMTERFHPPIPRV
jgi:hypothetical protein